MDNDILWKALVGGLIALAAVIKVLADLLKARKAKPEKESGDPPLTEKRAKELFLSKDDVKKLLERLLKPLLTLKEAETLVDTKYRTLVDSLLQEIPCYHQKEECHKIIDAAIKEVRTEISRDIDSVLTEMTTISRIVAKIHGASGRHRDTISDMIPKKRKT